jgi:HPt (histidine-containing phosphotransfer) domain-containing protein
MDDYISKPVRMEELIAVLERSATCPTADPTDTPAAQPDPAVDREVLMRLLADLGDDPTIIVELIDLFLQDAPTLLADLRRGLAASQAQMAQRAAHTLKSTSASLGAQALAAYCHDMEMLASEALPDQGAGMLAQIETTYAQAELDLLQIRAEMATRGGEA